MNDLKYVIFILKGMTTESAMLFRGCLMHAIAKRKGIKVVAAGFCTISIDNQGDFIINCNGHAVTLDNIASRGAIDSQVIKNTLFRTHSYTEY